MSASTCPRSESPRFPSGREPIEGAAARFPDPRAEPKTLARVGGGWRLLSSPQETPDCPRPSGPPQAPQPERV